MRAVRVVAVAAAFSALAVGCGSSSGTGSGAATSSATSAPAPEDITTSVVAVATGLRQLDTLTGQIDQFTGVGDKVRATALADQIEPIWETVEGTVKAKDQNLYLAFEDGFALLKTGAAAADATKVRQGVAAVTQAVNDYLHRFPA
jgi:hypothetical protein